MTESSGYTVVGPAWLWHPEPPAKGSWYFLRIDGDIAAEIRFLSFGGGPGFGSVPVWATIGATRWRTSLFRASTLGGYLLPLKADVRKRENIIEGTSITAQIEI